jgi:hypothetical protein
MSQITNIAKAGTVKFLRARRGELIYSVEPDGYQFSVPIADMGDGEFKAEDKAIYFIRWIRPVLEAMK